MVITKVETLHCDAGWRPWTFIKISTDEGLVGWSECTDSFGSPRGIEGVIKDNTGLQRPFFEFIATKVHKGLERVLEK